MPNKRSLAELLSSFARRIDDRNEQDGIRGYLKILKELTNTDIIFVARLKGRSASVVVGLDGDDNFEDFVYELEGTPCDIAAAGNCVQHAPDVQDKFPHDELLTEMNIHGYIGLPLLDLSGNVHGIIVGLNHHKEEKSKDHNLLYRMVSQLIQVEFRNLVEVDKEFIAFDNIDVKNVPNMGRFFYSVLENLPGNISVISTKNVFVYVNEGYADFFNLKPNDLIGKNIKEIFPKAMYEISINTDKEIIDSKKSSNFDYRSPLSDGGVFYSNVTKFPFINSDGEVYAVGMMSFDISESVKNRKELREEKLKNIQATKLATVGEMAASLTHELANPLTIIQGLSEKVSILVDRNVEKETVQVDLDKIKSATTRMGKLINSLRTFSRDDSKEKFEKTPLKDILDVTVDLISHRFDKENVQFDSNVVLNDVFVNAQTVLISQVLINLFMNSLDAIYENDDKWIKLIIEDLGQDLIIRIVDSGCGIEDEVVMNMFNSFYTTKEIGRGTGLGLSLCKEIVEQHNAELVYELYNGNTSFLIKIPKA